MRELVEVASQADLDRVVAEGNVAVCRSGFFHASDNASVSASGNASVRAYDNASVSAYGNASVRAYGDASVSASGDASVSASGNASVSASGNASVSAFDDASVSASGNASVRAYDNASVSAYDDASVRASKYVAIHRHGETPRVDGGVLIQIPDLTVTANFLDFYGVDVEGDAAVLYKAVDKSWRSGRGASYEPGSTTSCDDWDPHNDCGNGLHLSPRPFLAERYHHADSTRFVAVRVRVADIVVIGDAQPDKVKVPSCECLHEVDVDGEPLKAAA